jgi:hypothetical protein
MLNLLYDSRVFSSVRVRQATPPGRPAILREQSQVSPPRLLREVSLLIVCNNGPSVLNPKGWNRANTVEEFEPWRWLMLYALPMRLRMLVLTSVNLGYYCGELQTLTAASHILEQFPWVLYSSGPDSLPTPMGLLRLGALVAEDLSGAPEGNHAATPPRTRPALICEKFPSWNSLLRIRLDHFLAFPSRGQLPGVWLAAASDCVARGSRVPEQTLAYTLRTRNVSIQMLGSSPLGYIYESSKYETKAPHSAGMVWHAHNTTNVDAWIDAQESKYRNSSVPLRTRALVPGASRGAFSRCMHHPQGGHTY